MTGSLAIPKQSEPPPTWSCDATPEGHALDPGAPAGMDSGETPEGARAPEAADTERLWESLSQMISSIAHGVKTPLGILLMGTEFLDKKVASNDPTVGRVLDDMRNAIGRANGIVRALLELSCAEKPEPRWEDLHALIDVAVLRFAPEWTAKRVTIVRDFACRVPSLALDRRQCILALQHLLANGLFAVPPDGTIAIRTRLIEGADGRTALHLLIEDDGPGIPAAVLPRAFEPFFTTDKGGAKPGLGLTVARRIFEANGGRIVLANRESGGAAVSVIFGAGLAPREGATRAPLRIPAGRPN